MDIKLTDNIILKSDTYNFWLMAIVEPENKKPYEKRVSGYFQKLGDCLADYTNRKFRGLEVDSVKALAAEVESLKEEVRSFCNVLEKEGKIVRGC